MFRCVKKFFTPRPDRTAEVLDAIKSLTEEVMKMNDSVDVLKANEATLAAAIADLKSTVDQSAALLQQLHTDLLAALSRGSTMADIQAIADKLAVDTAALTAAKDALAGANAANAEQALAADAGAAATTDAPAAA
jgi:DNA repair exonuclease SbcCD ATPase subunit